MEYTRKNPNCHHSAYFYPAAERSGSFRKEERIIFHPIRLRLNGIFFKWIPANTTSFVKKELCRFPLKLTRATNLTKRKCLRLGIFGYWRVVKVWDLQVKSIKTEVKKLFINISNVRMFGQLECTGHTDDNPSSWSSIISNFTVERNGAGKKVNMRALELGLYLVQTTETFERISLKRVIQAAYFGNVLYLQLLMLNIQS